MKTLDDIQQMSGQKVYDYLDTATDIPVHTGLVAQGDIMVIPEVMWECNGITVEDGHTQPVPPAGIIILSGMHSHVLVAEPTAATWTTTVTDRENLALGIIDVTATAYILHEEHGAVGLAPGRYCVRQSREQADVLRKVAD